MVKEIDKRMTDKIYFITGKLAQMLGITKQTLIYYDKIG